MFEPGKICKVTKGLPFRPLFDPMDSYSIDPKHFWHHQIYSAVQFLEKDSLVVVTNHDKRGMFFFDLTSQTIGVVDSAYLSRFEEVT